MQAGEAVTRTILTALTLFFATQAGAANVLSIYCEHTQSIQNGVITESSGDFTVTFFETESAKGITGYRFSEGTGCEYDQVVRYDTLAITLEGCRGLMEGKMKASFHVDRLTGEFMQSLSPIISSGNDALVHFGRCRKAMF